MISTLAHDAIALHYQPMAPPGGEIAGFESLMRWHHQQRGAISPEAFIPIFEESGMIVPLSRWALEQATTEAASWKRPLQIAVNLSPVQFAEDDLVALVSSVLEKTGLAPERLELETTERPLLAHPERSFATLSALRDLGVEIALDDFGAGGSSRDLLRDFPFTKVKIARSVIEKVESSAAACSIVRMIIALGQSMNVTVAAKGVETGGQFAFLRQVGCGLIQGYLVGRPASIATYASVTGAPANSEPQRATRRTDRDAVVAPELSYSTRPDAPPKVATHPEVTDHRTAVRQRQ